MSTPINLNINVFNGTEDVIDFRYREQFNEAFLQKADNYAVAITRIQVPTSETETFVVSDNQLFKFYITSTDSTGVDVYNNTALPDDIDDYDDAIGYGTVKYYSNEDVLERISRIMYRTFVKSCKTTHAAATYQRLTDKTATGSCLSFMTSSVTSIYQDFTVTVDAASVLSDLKVNIHELLLSTTNFNASIDTYTPSYVRYFKIKIRNPAGVETVLLALQSGAMFTNTKIPSDWANNKILCLTEESFRSAQNGYNGTKATKATENYLPTETMIKLYGTTANGTWRITLETTALVYGRLRYSVALTSVLDTFPSTPPTVSMNTDSRIQITYDEKYVKNNLVFGFSPNLRTILDFGNSNMTYNTTKGIYELTFPNYVFNENGGLVTLKQNNSTRNLLCNLTRIIISSSSIPSDPEYGASHSIQSILSDFVIDTDVESLGVLQYSENAGVYPWRRYKLRSPISFSNFDIDIRFEYSHGVNKIARIAPGQTGSMRLSFFRV